MPLSTPRITYIHIYIHTYIHTYNHINIPYILGYLHLQEGKREGLEKVNYGMENPRSTIFDVLDPSAEIWPNSIPEVRFSTFWTPGWKYGQNRSQKHDFRRFGPLGGSMAKINPTSMIFDVLDPSAEVWPKSIPEARFSTFWTPRRKHDQNRSQKHDFRRFGPLG